MANSMSKTCRPKVRVMVAVMTCGSRIVTSDSSTTIIDFAARASRGLINDAVASATPPTTAVRRPNPVTLIPHSLLGDGQRSGDSAKEKRADGRPVSAVRDDVGDQGVSTRQSTR